MSDMTTRLASRWIGASKLTDFARTLVSDPDEAEELADTFGDLLSQSVADAREQAVKLLTKKPVKYSEWSDQWEGTEDPDDTDIYYSMRVTFAHKARVQAAVAVDLHKRLGNSRAWGRTDPDTIKQLVQSPPAQDQIKSLARDEVDPPGKYDRGFDLYSLGDRVVEDMTQDINYDTFAETSGPDEDEDYSHGEFPDTREKFRSRVVDSGGSIQLKGSKIIVSVHVDFAIKLEDVAFPWEWDYDR